MKREYFITKKVISKILAIYGGRRKYVLVEKYTRDKQDEVVFTEKKNKYKWLTMHNTHDGDVRVSFTDEGGNVIQNDFFTMDGEKKEMFPETAEELSGCVGEESAVIEKKESAAENKMDEEPTVEQQVYQNEDQKCECWKCELRNSCVYRDKYQRHPKSVPGALGLCKKLDQKEYPKMKRTQSAGNTLDSVD